MARRVYLLVAFAALSGWAGAQNPAPPLSAEDRVRLLKANGTLLDNLVRDGVALSSADTPEDRAARCRGSALALANAIQQAAAADDADRVAELTALYCDLVRDGLVPMLAESQRLVPPESPSGKKLREVRGHATADVSRVRAANEKVKGPLARLDAISDELK
jgi:hypothetical protein